MSMAKENVNINMNMRQKAMISQPMKGMSKDDILAVREYAAACLKEQGYDIVDNYFADFPDNDFVSDDTKNVSIAYLAKSIERILRNQ